MLSPATKRQIRSLATEGYSHRGIARALGIDRGSVGRVLASAPPAPAPPAPPEPAPPAGPQEFLGAGPPPAEPPPVAAPPAPPEEDGDLLAEVRSLMGELRSEARSCALAGDTANSAKFARVSASLAPLIFRLERSRATDDGSVMFPAAELSAKQDQLQTILRTLASGPFLCTRCGREERAAWDVADDREPPAPTPRAPAPRAPAPAPAEPEEDSALTKYRLMMRGGSTR